MKRVLPLLSLLAVVASFIGGFLLTSAYASGGEAMPEVSGAIDVLLSDVLSAFKEGDYTAAGLLAVVLSTAALRKFGAKSWPWLSTDLGSSVLVLVGTFAAMLAATQSLSWDTVWDAAKLAATAAGGYALARRIGGAVLDKWGDKLPDWARTALRASLWLFQKPEAAAVADAERAGHKAADAVVPVGAGKVKTLP